MTIHRPEFDDKRPAYLRLRDVENQIKLLKKQREELLAELTPQGNHTFAYEGEYYTAKIVQGTSYAVDLLPLKKRSPGLFDQVTKVILDKAAVRTLVENRLWPSEVKDLVKLEYNSPWIKVSKLDAQGHEVEFDDEAGVA